MTYNHELTTEEADALAKRLDIPGPAVTVALEEMGMLRDPGMEVVDELTVLGTILDDLGTVNMGGEEIKDECAMVCYLAGRLLRRIAPDVAALCAAAGVDGARNYVH